MMNINDYIQKIRNHYNELANKDIYDFLNSNIFYIEAYIYVPVINNKYLKSKMVTIKPIENKTYNECVEYIKNQVTEEEWNSKNKMIKDRDGYYATNSQMFYIKFNIKE